MARAISGFTASLNYIGPLVDDVQNIQKLLLLRFN